MTMRGEQLHVSAEISADFKLTLGEAMAIFEC